MTNAKKLGLSVLVLLAFSAAACGSDSDPGGSAGAGGKGNAGSAGAVGGSGGRAGSGSTAGAGGAVAGNGSGGASAGSAGEAGEGGEGGQAGEGGAAGEGGGAGAGGDVTLDFDFTKGANGFVAGFADYNPATLGMELDSGVKALPSELNKPGTGFFITGNNHSDDLYMFLKRKIGTADGLLPSQRYALTFQIVVASNAQVGCVGVGGAPGEGVTLKAGASTAEPLTTTVNDHLRMTIDKGNQGVGGVDASVVSNIANGIACGQPVKYVSLTKNHAHPKAGSAAPRTDASGNLWLTLGTDSGFEATTALYYQSVRVTLKPVN